MDLKERVNVVQAKMNGAVAALTYGYFAHMNDAGGTVVDIGTDLKAVDNENINNSACSSEMLRGLVHAFTDNYKGKLTLDETVCDPKYIPSNCIMKDKYGYMQRGAAAELSIDYPLTDSKKHDWTETFVSDTSRGWGSVCYGDGKFVAVASKSYFAYSMDGITWTEGKISDTSRNWESVCYGNGKFVAVSYQYNYFAYSTDGINWIETNNGLTSRRRWQSVCYGNDKFVAVADSSNYFAYSTDGITWTETSNGLSSRTWYSVCYGNNKFVTVAGGTTNTNYFAYSTDGINWIEGTISSTSRRWNSVCYGNGKYVAVESWDGYFAYSTDGITWTEGTISDASRDWYSVCYGNGKFVVVDSGTNYFAYSTDGITWTEGTISNTWRSWCSICYGNNKFIIVASNNNYFAYYKPNCDFNICDSFKIKDKSYTRIGITNAIMPNISDIDGTFINMFHDHIKNYYPDRNIGVITYNDKNIPAMLNNIIKNGMSMFILTFDENDTYKKDYYADQNYKYMLAFDDSNNKDYFIITNDLLHYTTYDVTALDRDYISFKNGIIFIYLPEKDAVAMITRHPHTTDINTIDGNDPENMTDITKPYYRLIEIPFLKNYYKYTGKHVKNVKICVKPFIDNDNEVYTDCTLLINVFDRVYKIGIPNYIDRSDKYVNDKRLQNFYTSTTQTLDQINDRNCISSLLNITDLNTEYINYSIFNNYNNYIYNTNHLKITIDEMNYGYDHDADNTRVQTYNIVNNYTNTGYGSFGDIPEKDYVYLPTAIYEYYDNNEGGDA